MDRERVIVYIDENTDDGMMWEELNQEGQMQVSVYDEEYEYDVEYHHSIKVKSLQEYLAEHDKQVRKEVIENLKQEIIYYPVGLLGIDGKSHKNSLGISKEILESYFEKILDQKQGEL